MLVLLSLLLVLVLLLALLDGRLSVASGTLAADALRERLPLLLPDAPCCGSCGMSRPAGRTDALMWRPRTVVALRVAASGGGAEHWWCVATAHAWLSRLVGFRVMLRLCSRVVLQYALTLLTRVHTSGDSSTAAAVLVSAPAPAPAPPAAEAAAAAAAEAADSGVSG